MIHTSMRANARRTLAVVTVAIAFAAGCSKNPPPVAKVKPPPEPAPSASGTTAPAPRPPAPPEPVREPVVVPPEPAVVSSASLDDLNKASPLKPVFFAYDSVEITPEAQSVLQENVATMKKNGTWTVTIEGHCDERGSAEYNLALGERRAVTVRAYLVSLGIPADRLRTVSYGKEFPFDPGHDEAAMAKNRRAHFVITSK
jgi:peptidoglycan-associated lipoprotein